MHRRPWLLGSAAGIYLLIRLAWWIYKPHLLPSLVLPALMVFGAISVLIAAVAAYYAADWKRFAAFQAVSQGGLAVVALASGTAAGLAGGLYHLASLMLLVPGLLLVAGSIERAADTDDAVGGLSRNWHRRLALTGLVLCGAVAAGIPETSGFMNRGLFFRAIIEARQPLVLLAALAANVLTAAALAGWVRRLSSTGEVVCDARGAAMPAAAVAAGAASAAMSWPLVPAFAIAALGFPKGVVLLASISVSRASWLGLGALTASLVVGAGAGCAHGATSKAGLR